MDSGRFYISIFLRRLPWFLVVATIISAVAVTVAISLPPAYVSQMRLIVESPQIPEELASSTVTTPPIEQLQIMEQRLLTRANMLDIARRLEVLPNLQEMNPDEIVAAMRARTTIALPRGRNPLPLMTITFEAGAPRAAAGVLNEYLTLIQQQDAEFRRGRAGETLEFFEQEVARLSGELDVQSARILEFKQANTNELPDSLDFRMSQQATLLGRKSDIAREITTLQNQRTRLVELFEQTGNLPQPETVSLSPDQERLAAMKQQLDEALVVYSAENPRVKLLQARIEQLEATVATNTPAPTPDNAQNPSAMATAPTALDIQLAEIDTRIAVLEEEQAEVEAQLETLNASISRTPGISITLEELERRYSTIQLQFNQAEDRLARAQTGDRIETRSRGQRLSVIEQPAVPSGPTKPNRVLIAGGGVAFGIMAGLGLVLLLELVNTTARRPEDLVKRFEITPFTTIPYIRTRGQTFLQRSVKVGLVLAILIGIPAATYAVHLYYLPLDLLADRVMNKIGIRW